MKTYEKTYLAVLKQIAETNDRGTKMRLKRTLDEVILQYPLEIEGHVHDFMHGKWRRVHEREKTLSLSFFYHLSQLTDQSRYSIENHVIFYHVYDSKEDYLDDCFTKQPIAYWRNVYPQKYDEIRTYSQKLVLIDAYTETNVEQTLETYE